MLGQQQAMLDHQAMLEQQQQKHEFPELPEDSPELKTPTAEDIMVPEQKVCSVNRINFASLILQLGLLRFFLL